MLKHESVLEMLAQLSAVLNPSGWEVVDHWEADLHAVGIARRGQPEVLVYVSTYGLPPGRFSCECEPAGCRGAVAGALGTAEGIDFKTLVSVIEGHLHSGDMTLA